MMDYRCYHMDANGHIVDVELFALSNDPEACLRAHAIVAAQKWNGYELWQLSRKVICPNQN